MARPPSTSALWPVAMVVAPCAPAAPLVLALLAAPSRWAMAAACGTGAAALLGLLLVLWRAHRATAAELAHQRAETARRLAELARRDKQWRSFTDQQAALLRQECEHLLTERLPAVFRGREVPPVKYRAQLPETVVRDFERVVAEIAERLAERSESQRLAMVALAGRVQTSAHRIQAAVTTLSERHGHDPDILEAAMWVDHAATQQARHAQSLQVLGGEWPGQRWEEPMALVDVVRAASGRIVAYRRVEVAGEQDVGAAARVVEPLIHLIAELLANATEHSPPRTVVPVMVRTVQRGAVIEIDDGGLGMDEYRMDRARQIVSGRRPVALADVGEVPRTGFAVVGRFAARHGFQVDLSPSPYGGVRVVILIGRSDLATVEPLGAGGGRGRRELGPAPGRLPGHAPRPGTGRGPGTDPRSGRGLVQGSGSAPGLGSAPGPGSVPGPAPGSGSAPRPGTQPVPQPRPEPSGSAPRHARAPEPTPQHGQDPAPPPLRPSGLPQRASRRGETLPRQPWSAPPEPQQTPEEAGDWMETFLAGGAAGTPAGHADPTTHPKG
ncbi:ATP-binding protein [Streptomyces sp. G-5]|uniref:ATP-binding protein n=1 Tax=Streptomyces sp. G-5 TaxID=2977231 RepID=UPI0021D2721C|nr:ATP-binding protein [Streptomyces sp. G-5]MCU4747142.1 sensor histidine kinase [Streptomyces sp. G-5]